MKLSPIRVSFVVPLLALSSIAQVVTITVSSTGVVQSVTPATGSVVNVQRQVVGHAWMTNPTTGQTMTDTSVGARELYVAGKFSGTVELDVVGVGSVFISGVNNVVAYKYFPSYSSKFWLNNLDGGVTGTDAEVLDMELGGSIALSPGSFPVHVIIGGAFSAAGGQSHQNLAFYHRLHGFSSAVTDVKTSPTAKVTGVGTPSSAGDFNPYTVAITYANASSLEDDEHVYYAFTSTTTLTGIGTSSVISPAWDLTVPAVSVLDIDNEASEEADWYPDNDWQQYGTTWVTITRTGPTTFPLTVHFSYSGDATPGVDFVNEDTSGEKHYGLVYHSITIPTNSSSVQFPVIPLYDELIEGTETLYVTIDADPAYSIAGTDHWIYIYDYVP